MLCLITQSYFLIILIFAAIWWCLQQQKSEDGDLQPGQSPSRRPSAPKVSKPNTDQQDEYLDGFKKNKLGFTLQAQIEFERDITKYFKIKKRWP